MEQILACKPTAQLENAEPRIKTYILQLEKRLQNTLLLENFDLENEAKCLDLQKELFSMKLQKEETEQHAEIHKKQMKQLKLENDQLKIEITKLKQTIKELQPKQLNNKCHMANKPLANSKIVDKHLPNSEADSNSVLVKGFSELELHTNPKADIISLGRQMDLEIAEENIVKVSTMERKFFERHNLKPNKIILIVQFRKPELKVDFLKRKEKLKLKSNSKFEEIEITDYVSEDVYNLYQYAKILKSHGYVSIYWRNNCVYAKQNRSNFCDAILIKSKNDVDILKDQK